MRVQEINSSVLRDSGYGRDSTKDNSMKDPMLLSNRISPSERRRSCCCTMQRLQQMMLQPTLYNSWVYGVSLIVALMLVFNTLAIKFMYYEHGEALQVINYTIMTIVIAFGLAQVPAYMFIYVQISRSLKALILVSPTSTEEGSK